MGDICRTAFGIYLLPCYGSTHRCATSGRYLLLKGFLEAKLFCVKNRFLEAKLFSVRKSFVN